VANTKNISDRQERKAKKRTLRRGLKVEFGKLNKDQKRRFRKSEIVGLRKWIVEELNKG